MLYRRRLNLAQLNQLWCLAEATLYLARLEGKGSSGTSSKSLLPGRGGLAWLLSRKPHSFRPELQYTDRVGNTTFLS